MSKAYGELQTYMDKAMAIKTAMTLFEWDIDTGPQGSGRAYLQGDRGSVRGIFSGSDLR